ncbi:MAG: helix-turn-helix domain-containing protein [Aristaeellaceae bacterium]
MMHAPEISPYIRRAWFDTLDSNGYIPERVIFDYELLYIKEGKCSIRVEDRLYTPQPGDFFLFRPRVTHAIQVSADTPLIQPHIHFDLCLQPDSGEVPVSMCPLERIPPEQMSFFRTDVLAEFISPMPDFVHIDNLKYAEGLMSDIIYLHTNKVTILDAIREKTLFLQLLHYILGEMALMARNRARDMSVTAQRVKTFLDLNSHQTLTLDEIAEKCYISKCYMVSIFTDTYGISPCRYHQQQRINEAKYMLKLTNLSISEIAAHIGFSSLRSFSALFVRMEGMSPTEYRRLATLSK